MLRCFADFKAVLGCWGRPNLQFLFYGAPAIFYGIPPMLFYGVPHILWCRTHSCHQGCHFVHGFLLRSRTMFKGVGHN